MPLLITALRCRHDIMPFIDATLSDATCACLRAAQRACSYAMFAHEYAMPRAASVCVLRLFDHLPPCRHFFTRAPLCCRVQ